MRQNHSIIVSTSKLCFRTCCNILVAVTVDVLTQTYTILLATVEVNLIHCEADLF